MMIFNKLPFLGLLLVFGLMAFKQSACSHKSNSDGETPATKARSAAFLQEKLSVRPKTPVRSLSAKAHIFVEGNGQSVEANANVLWIRDSILWINVKKFGLEAARGLITPDSAYLLDRLARTATIRSIASFQDVYHLPEGFELLQKTLLGQAWLEQGVDYQSDIKDGRHHLFGKSGTVTSEYYLSEGDFLLRKESFLRPIDSQFVSFEFDGFQALAGAGQFPYLRSIELFSPSTETIHIDITFSDVVINPEINYRFEIPDNYERL